MASGLRSGSSVTLTQQQLQQLIASVRAPGGSGGGRPVNNTAPTWNDITVNGKVIAADKVEDFFKTTLDLTNEQYNHLSFEGLGGPDKFIKFDSDEVETIFTNTNKSISIKAYSQIKIKQFCDWAQYLRDTG